MSNIILTTFLTALVYGDVRLDLKQKGTNTPIDGYMIPSTFGLQALVNQKKNNNDQFLRSNIDNEANKRNEATEAALDMTPFRQLDAGPVQTFPRGVPFDIPLRWNNPHDSSCEVNIWTNGMTQVAPTKAPFKCGGGYQDQKFSVTIPADFPGCTTEAEQCVMQIYVHSVEPRTYAIGINFVLSGAAAGGGTTAAGLRKRQANGTTTQFNPPVLYNDAFDTSHVDSQYSGYRGQQEDGVRPDVMAAITMQSYVGNGGLVPLGNIDKGKNANMRNKIQNAIKAAEARAIPKNKAAQRALKDGECFEGKEYGVVNNPNCNRQYTNTYVTNVDYVAIMNAMMPQIKAAGLTPYSPRLKSTPGTTPVDPFGQYLVNGKPSMTPRGKEGGGDVASPPADGKQVPQGQVGQVTAYTLGSGGADAPAAKTADGTPNPDDEDADAADAKDGDAADAKDGEAKDGEAADAKDGEAADAKDGEAAGAKKTTGGSTSAQMKAAKAKSDETAAKTTTSKYKRAVARR